jgi:hypothetical protein
MQWNAAKAGLAGWDNANRSMSAATANEPATMVLDMDDPPDHGGGKMGCPVRARYGGEPALDAYSRPFISGNLQPALFIERAAAGSMTRPDRRYAVPASAAQSNQTRAISLNLDWTEGGPWIGFD